MAIYTSIGMKAVAILTCAAVCAGCFGYNSSAKKWAYAGDAVLVLSGGGVIAADQLTKPGACSGMGCPSYTPPLSGALVAGVVLATAGLVGIIYTVTRAEVKTSR